MPSNNIINHILTYAIYNNDIFIKTLQIMQHHCLTNRECELHRQVYYF